MSTIMKETAEITLGPARMATLSELIRTTLPKFLSPVPSRDTLRDWFDGARIPRFKAHPAARRGGGPNYYSVAAVETFLRSRTLSCRLVTENLVVEKT
jgi:hypothetical protein